MKEESVPNVPPLVRRNIAYAMLLAAFVLSWFGSGEAGAALGLVALMGLAIMHIREPWLFQRP